jgi:ABC-type maltose transport system permease subunit
LFGTAFLFQVLHLLMFEVEFELATTVCILAGAASLIPATVSGWLTWKRHYGGAKARLFRRKIVVAFVMLAASIPLTVWRIVLYRLGNEADGIDHYVFFVITVGLIVGAIAEGYLGGRLSHK